MSGVIPGETDYRVYRDFGHIPGFDAAFVMDGWAYHSANDNFDRLAPHAGACLSLAPSPVSRPVTNRCESFDEGLARGRDWTRDTALTFAAYV